MTNSLVVNDAISHKKLSFMIFDKKKTGNGMNENPEN